MNKAASMRIRVEPDLHRDFMGACHTQGKPAAQVIRDLMRAFVESYYKQQQGNLFDVNES
jgi:hypothetical protein